MNKSESSASDHAVQRVPKLIIGALQEKEKKKNYFSAGVTFAQLNMWEGQGLAAG